MIQTVEEEITIKKTISTKKHQIMKKIIITTTLIIGTLIIFSCCKKEELDPCEGCYTEVFRCKIDGVDFVPYCKSGPLFGCSAIDCQYYKKTKSIELVVYNSKTKLNVQVRARPIYIGGNSLAPRKGAFQDWTNMKGCVFYDYDTISLGKLEIISIDTIKQIIKGEFEYDAINYCGDTVRIREGYFDVVYRF